MRHFWYLFDLHPSRMKAIYLSFHFSNSLVKLFCLPLHSCVNDLGLVKIDSTFIDFSLNLGFSFFNLSELGTQIVNGCFCLNTAPSPSALATSLRIFSRPDASSSRASFAPSTSCSRFLNFPRRSCLSLASLSHKALTSLSWAPRADLDLASMVKLLSRSPTMRRSSPFSLAILFFDIPKSLRVRFAASTFLLVAFSCSSRALLDLSAEA